MKYYLTCHCKHCNVIKNIKDHWLYCGNWGCKEYDNLEDAIEQFDRTIPYVNQVWTIYDKEYNIIIEKSDKHLNTTELCQRLTKEYAQQLLNEINDGKRYDGSILINRLNNIINDVNED